MIEIPGSMSKKRLRVFLSVLKMLFKIDCKKEIIVRGGSRGVAKFLSESNSFHIKSKAVKMLSCKDSSTLLDPPLIVYLTL